MRVLGFLFSALIMALSMTAANAQTQAGLRIATEATKQFHEQAGGAQVWSDENYAALITAITALEAHGLEPEHYRLSRLIALKDAPAERDRVATSAWLMAAAHLAFGKLDPVSVEPDWTAVHRPLELGSVLRYALFSGKMAGSLEQFAPVQPGYALLKTELARLRLVALTPVEMVPEGPALKSGMTNDRVTALQKRLVQLGLLPAEGSVTGSFDEPTEAAVETWQIRNELDADGVAGAATLRTLNRSVQDQIDKVRVNMERWRWLPADLGQRHLRANIAAFEVTAYENGAAVRTHLTIVGKNYRKTPVFSDEIEYIVFNPWWETPPSLARADKLPTFKKDPGAVQRLGFQILRDGSVVDPATINWNDYTASTFPFRIRQAPGPENALGQVKIMFPNVHNVYLHDTPTRGLFAQRQRAFSSGCLRTQDPIGLSKWLLEQTPEWDATRIDSVVAGGKETRATLSAKVPVHILYYTVVPDGLGGVRYMDDIYDRDGRVLNGLRNSPTPS